MITCVFTPAICPPQRRALHSSSSDEGDEPPRTFQDSRPSTTVPSSQLTGNQTNDTEYSPGLVRAIMGGPARKRSKRDARRAFR